MDIVKCILIACILGSLCHPVCGEVKTLSITTDKTWKSLDLENDGWNSPLYDDSWWEPAVEQNLNSLKFSKMIWYPGNIKPNIAYFRNSFSINGTRILNGKLSISTYGDGTIYLYINNNIIDKITTQLEDPAIIDITSYLKPGINLIAAKVDATNYHGWALVSTIKYDNSLSNQSIDEKNLSSVYINKTRNNFIYSQDFIIDKSSEVSPNGIAYELVYTSDKKSKNLGKSWSTICFNPLDIENSNLTHSLIGPIKIIFWMRGAKGGERIGLLVNNVLIDLLVLQNTWKRYEHLLPEGKTSFCLATNKIQNPAGCRIYLSEMKLVLNS
jgi:hypothetical protein